MKQSLWMAIKGIFTYFQVTSNFWHILQTFATWCIINNILHNLKFIITYQFFVILKIPGFIARVNIGITLKKSEKFFEALKKLTIKVNPYKNGLKYGEKTWYSGFANRSAFLTCAIQIGEQSWFSLSCLNFKQDQSGYSNIVVVT